MHRLIHSFSLLRPSISSIASISSSSSSPSLSCHPLRSSAPYRSMSASTAAASPSSSHYDYLVIGAGSGGLATARRAASYKARAAVIEQARVGGTCVNAGCVPKKLLFNAATIYETIRHHAREYGIEWPESANEEKSVTPNIKFNWKEFRERRNQYIDRLNGIYDSSLKKEGVDYIVGHAKLLGDNKVEVTGKNNEKTIYTASHITIAVGGEPLIPNIPGADLGITSDGFFDIIEQPKTVAIAGAGYIAVELAGIFKAFGCDVHLFIRYDSVLRSFDRFIIDGLTNEMKAAGIHIHNYSQIVGVEKNTDGQSLKLNIKQTSNAPSTHVSDASTLPSFDQLVWAIGRVPLTKTIGLDSVGIKTNEGGYIIADDYENTNINNYYAIGDVNGKAELTPVAIAAGRKLADRLFNGIKDSKLSYDNIPTVVFSHPPIGTIGMSEQQAVDEYGVDDIVLYKASFRNLYYGPLTEKVMTHMKLVCVKSLHEKVVGLHVVGMGADEMLQGFGVAIKMGATKKDLDSVVAIHPTAAEEFVTMKTPYPATAKPTPKL